MGEQLVITARRKDVIIINGRNIWPQDLEHIAEGVPRVRMGNVSAFSVTEDDGKEIVVMVVESRHTNAELAEELARRIQIQFGISVHVDLVRPRTLPRTSSGKLSRSRAKQDFLERSNLPACESHQDYAVQDSVA
jgi:fatty-acyl-CoA synthase